MPEEWQTEVICLIYKNGNKLACENYKGTSLLNVVYKIFTDMLARRIEVYTDEILGEYHGGFRQCRSTSDHIRVFTFRQILEKLHECNISLHQLYIVTDVINALPGNSSVNTVQHATIDEAVFYVVRATPSAANGQINSQSTRVEAGSNTSTVTLRVVGGDEKEVSNPSQ
jgi:hypothetical protein